MFLHPDLLPETADPAGSTRYESVNIVRLLIPCKEEGILTQFYKEDNTFIIYDCSPKYGNQGVDSFKGTVLEEADGSYSWWESINQKGTINNEDSD